MFYKTAYQLYTIWVVQHKREGKIRTYFINKKECRCGILQKKKLLQFEMKQPLLIEGEIVNYCFFEVLN